MILHTGIQTLKQPFELLCVKEAEIHTHSDLIRSIQRQPIQWTPAYRYSRSRFLMPFKDFLGGKCRNNRHGEQNLINPSTIQCPESDLLSLFQCIQCFIIFMRCFA
jgi:hypothetical protein